MRQKSFKPISSNLTSSARERGIFFFFFPFFSLSWREQNVLKATGRQEERGLSPNDMVYDCNLGVCVCVFERESEQSGWTFFQQSFTSKSVWCCWSCLPISLSFLSSCMHHCLAFCLFTHVSPVLFSF